MRVGSLAVVVAALTIVCAAEASGQTSGPCRVLVNGVEAGGADSPERAIRVDARERLTIEGAGFEAPSPVKVELDFGPFKRTVFEHRVESAETWRTTIDVRDYARYGVGLYHVIATSDRCRLDAWVRVVGRSPFRTVVGIAAVALLLLGLVLVGVGLAAGAPLLIGIAAAGVGLGALLLGQQIGILPLTTANAILFVVGAPVVVAVVKGLTSVLARQTLKHLPEGIRRSQGVPGPSVERPPRDAPAMRLPGPSVEGPVGHVPGTARREEIQRERPRMKAPPRPAPIYRPPHPRMEPPTAPEPAAPASLPSPSVASTRAEFPDEVTADRAREPVDSYDEYGGESAGAPPEAPTRPESRDEVGAGGSRDRVYSYDSYEAEPAADLEEEPTVASEATPGATRIEHLPRLRTDDSQAIRMMKLPPDPERDPPRSAFALLECPEAVVAEREFALTVGLGPRPTAGVVSARMDRPESSVGPYTLTTQLVAEGFALRDDESWRQDMRVTADEPYPTITLHLSAEPQEAGIHARMISATYSVDGQVIGIAYRSIAVARNDELLAEASVEPQEAGVDLSVPTDRVPADLTLIIRRSNLAKGRLLWNLETAFEDIRVPEKALPVEVGDEPEAFARQLASQVNLREGRAGIYPLLLGVARSPGPSRS